MDLEALVSLSKRIEENPKNYFQGLPDGPRFWPQNILMFRRSHAIQPENTSVHHRHLLITSLRGNGNVLIEDQVFALSPGQMILIGPHQFHHYAQFATQDIDWLFVTFECEQAEAISQLSNQVMTLAPRSMESLAELLRAYQEASESKRANPNINAMLAQMLLSENAKTEPSKKRLATDNHHFLSRLLTLIHRELQHPLPLERCATEMNLCESHLRSKFKKLTGESLGQYIRKRKIHLATQMLQNSSKSITQICDEGGFESLYSFSRTFKMVTGLSPKAYRMRHMGSDVGKADGA